MNNSSNTTTRNTLSPVESACHALLDFIAREVFENKAPEEDVRERCKVFTALLNEGFKALLDEAGLNLSNLRKQCEELESQITRLDSQSDAICRRGAQIERFIGHHLPFFRFEQSFLILPVSHVNQRLLRLSRLCPVVSPVICQSKGHLSGCHLFNRCREPVMLMNKSKLNGLLNADTVIVQKKTSGGC